MIPVNKYTSNCCFRIRTIVYIKYTFPAFAAFTFFTQCRTVVPPRSPSSALDTRLFPGIIVNIIANAMIHAKMRFHVFFFICMPSFSISCYTYAFSGTNTIYILPISLTSSQVTYVSRLKKTAFSSRFQYIFVHFVYCKTVLTVL